MSFPIYCFFDAPTTYQLHQRRPCLRSSTLRSTTVRARDARNLVERKILRSWSWVLRSLSGTHPVYSNIKNKDKFKQEEAIILSRPSRSRENEHRYHRLEATRLRNRWSFEPDCGPALSAPQINRQIANELDKDWTGISHWFQRHTVVVVNAVTTNYVLKMKQADELVWQRLTIHRSDFVLPTMSVSWTRAAASMRCHLSRFYTRQAARRKKTKTNDSERNCKIYIYHIKVYKYCIIVFTSLFETVKRFASASRRNCVEDWLVRSWVSN